MRSVRWLLLKDVQILRRSPLLVGLLVVYPVVIALLIGLALSRGPAKPRVAIANLVPAGQTIDIGGRQINIDEYASHLYQNIVPVPVATREQAIAKVRSGDVIAALVIPADIVQRLSSGLQQADAEVIYNGDALTASYVRSTIDSALGQANAALSGELEKVAAAVHRPAAERRPAAGLRQQHLDPRAASARRRSSTASSPGRPHRPTAPRSARSTTSRPSPCRTSA